MHGTINIKKKKLCLHSENLLTNAIHSTWDPDSSLTPRCRVLPDRPTVTLLLSTCYISNPERYVHYVVTWCKCDKERKTEFWLKHWWYHSEKITLPHCTSVLKGTVKLWHYSTAKNCTLNSFKNKLIITALN